MASSIPNTLLQYSHMSFAFAQFDEKATKAINHITQEVASMRSGRATSQLLDPVVVEAYGTHLKINEVAAIEVPESTLIRVVPWDKGLLASIEKAIASAGLNLNPVVAGELIRIVVPALTQERRQEMVKLVHQKIESGRVMVRSIRTDTKKDIEKQKGQAGVSEDMIAAELSTLEEKTKGYLDTLDKILSNKEKELMTV